MKKQEILITVLMSVYNEEKNIEESIKSILNQTYSNFEFIIIDDGSTDNTVEIIRKFNDERIILIRNYENFGLTKNLNSGLNRALGKYIVRMDGDDVAYPSRLEQQVQFMEEHQEIALSGCWMKIFGQEKSIWKQIIDSETLKVNLLFNTVIFHPTFIIRKAVLDRYNLKYDEELLYAQDYDLCFRVSKYGNLANVSDILVKYRVHDGQISIDKYGQQLECANITRKKLLSELNIYLEDDVFSYWQRFCLFDYHELSNVEQEELQKICKRIVENNEVRRVYNQDILQEEIERRLKEYISQCVSEAKEVVECEEEKYHRLFAMMCYWFKAKQSGKSIMTFFKDGKMQEIAIYGMGDVGLILLEELRKSKIIVKYGIDKNPSISCYVNGIPMYTPQDSLEEVDAIIVTSVTYYDEIKKILEIKLKCPIISLEDIVHCM